jgi:hypothetical protein
MKVLLRLSVCGVVLGVAVAFVGCVLVPWLGGPTLLGMDFRELFREMGEERQRQEALRVREEAMMHCLKGKQEVTEAVIAGRLPLAEAVRRFRRLQGLMDDGQDEVLGTYSIGGVGNELMARNVLLWVRVALGKRPEGGEVLRRLEKELEGLRARDLTAN